MAPSHVLVALDGSPLADDALVHALETFDCRVTVLNVVTPLDASMSESGVLEPDEERRENARERSAALIEEAKRRGEEVDRAAEGDPEAEGTRSVETAIETGDPADTIVAYVERGDVDHVVMGGHGGERNELAKRLLGTVATKVVTEAPVTVTVVR